MSTSITNEAKISGLASHLATPRWLPAKFIWLNALALAAMVAGLALACLLPQGPEFHKINPGAILIFFDGRWYQNIAFTAIAGIRCLACYMAISRIPLSSRFTR